MLTRGGDYQSRYYRKHREVLRLKHREYMREYTQRPEVKQRMKEYRRQHTLGTSKGRIAVHKRPRPNNTCEVCGGEFKRLEYHHWNEALPELGVWVCYKCHQRAEMVDKAWEHLEKYLSLKQEII